MKKKQLKNDFIAEQLNKPNETYTFKTEQEVISFLINKLEGYNLIDFLEKLSCLNFFILTDNLKCEMAERKELKCLFNNSFTFFFSFLLCYKINSGVKLINYNDLFTICTNLNHYLNYRKLQNLESYQEDTSNGKIDYIQNNITDLIGGFKRIPIGDILSCENELIKDKYNVDTEELVYELIDIFYEEIYNSFKCKNISVNEFVDNFSKYVNTEKFIIKKEYKAFKLCDDLAIEFGKLNKNISFDNPLSVINLSRKLFIKFNDNLYNISDELICGRLNKSVEYLFHSEKQKWRENYKEKTEGVIKEVFEYFLPGGKYYENNYYKDLNNKLCENDGIYVYHNVILCIEIKGNKFNPDPIIDNVENVKKSYDDVINKADSQVERIKSAISNQKNFNILNANGSLRMNLNVENKKIIGLCLYFEDIGTLVSGLPVNYNNIIHISYYDLLLVLNYLENPFLIVKYLYERSLPLKDDRYYINDELIFLSLFRNCIHLNDFINSQIIPEELNIGHIYLPNDDFGEEIALYFMNGGTKPAVELNDFLKQVISLNDFSKIDDNVFTGISYLIELSREELDDLEKIYKEKNKNSKRLAISLVFKNSLNENFALMFISKAHSPYQKKQNLAFAKKYLKSKKETNCVYLIEICKDYTTIEEIIRDSNILDDIDDVSLLSEYNLELKEHVINE